MLEALFGWRKASKCKDLIKRVRCRLKLLRNKRDVIVRQLKQDVVQLLRNGQHKSAFSRVEQLFKDQSILAVYDLLDHFCEFIIIQLPYIREHRDCPNDINEAISSLIFAAARCADLPELQTLRRLFGERYGHEFAVAAVELFPHSLVNRQMSEKLSIRSVSEDSKLRLIEEIATEYSLPLAPPEVEDDHKELHQKVSKNQPIGINKFNWERKVQERNIQVISSSKRVGQTRVYSIDKHEQKHTGDENHTEKETRSPGMLSRWKKLMANSCQSRTGTNIKSNSIITVTAAPAADPVQSHMNSSLPRGSQEIDCARRLLAAPMQSKVETSSTENLSERSTQFAEKIIVYLDDEDDGHYPTMEEESGVKDEGEFPVKLEALLQRENHMPSKIGMGLVGSLQEKQENGNGRREDRSNLGTCRARLSDIQRDDHAIKDINFDEWQEERTSTGCSSKKKKLGRQSLDKRSTTSHSVNQKENVADYDEFSDFFDTSGSQSRNSHTGEGNPSVSMAASLKYADYAIYYEEMDDDSDVESLVYSWKARDSIDKRNNSSQGSQHNSMLNPDKILSTRSDLPSVNGKTRKSYSRNNRRRSNSSCGLIPHVVEDSWTKSPSSNGRRRSMTLIDKGEENCHCRCCSSFEGIGVIASNKEGGATQDRCNRGGVSAENARNSYDGRANKHAINIAEPEFISVSFLLNQSIDLNQKKACQDRKSGFNDSDKVVTQIHKCIQGLDGYTGDDDDDDDDDNAVSSHGSCYPGEVQSGSGARKAPMLPPYSRAMTMPPPKRPKCSPMNQTRRSASFGQPSRSSSVTHIHPRLPDYDDLAAKFTALKNEHRLTTARASNA